MKGKINEPGGWRAVDVDVNSALNGTRTAPSPAEERPAGWLRMSSPVGLDAAGERHVFGLRLT